jgi:hypothetical protein
VKHIAALRDSRRLNIAPSALENVNEDNFTEALQFGGVNRHK